jgi:ABC-type uncharacterized transport system substrate-binding protein
MALVMGLRRPIFAAALLAANVSPAQAHPHVWITYLATLVFQGGKVTALREQWTFDRDFTLVALGDLPTGAATKVIKASDIPILEKSEFSNLRNYGYFHHVFLGETDQGIGDLRDFTARLSGQELVYNFTLALKAPIDPRATPPEIGIWDDSFFVDVEPASDAGITIEGDGTAGCSTTIVQDEAHSIFDGMVTPPAIKLTCVK